MKNSNLVEQDDGYATALALADLRTKTTEKGFDVLPSDVCTGWMCEDRFQRLRVGTLHQRMVPEFGTGCNRTGI